MLRIGKNGLDIRLLHNTAKVHHAHLVRDLCDHAAEIFHLMIEYMIDEGRELPLSTIHDRFSGVLQTKESVPLYGACEILCKAGIFEEGVYETRLTKKSTVAFTEPAYAYIGDVRKHA